MATMISPGQYRISLPNETVTSSISWNTLVGTSTNQTLKLMGLYYGTSGTVDMGGGTDTLIINVNARARLDLKNTEFVYAAEGKSVILQLMNTMGSTFTTDGTIKEITGAGTAKHRVTFEHGLAQAGTRPNGNSVVNISLGGGTQDVVNFEHATRVVSLPGGGSYTQNAWVIYATPTGYAAYNNFRDYTVNVAGTVDQLTYNGDVYIPGTTNLLISNVAFNWAANVASTSFIVNVPSVNVYFRTGGVNSFLDNNAVFVTSNNVGLAQNAGISARAVAEEGVIRVEAGISTDDSTEHLFIGTTGADTMAASTTNATALYGFAGNDVLTGNAGADTMFGGLGNDTITGGAGDTIYGNEDNDVIVGFATGTVLVDGGTGANTLQVDSTAAIAGLAAASDAALINVQTVSAAAATAGVSINLSAQTDGFTVVGSGEQDTIATSQGADTLTTGARADTLVFGTAGSLAAAIDTVTDYEDDVLDFGGDAVLGGAGGATVAATSVVTSANGKVTFDAADDTLAEKIAAIRADSRLDAANSVAVFSDGADSYVYYAGAAAGNTDDQIVKLAGQSSLDKITVSGGNVTLDTEPPASGLTTTLSLLPTTNSWTGAVGSATPTGYTPGNDGNSNTSQGDGVNGTTNQLIRNSSGNFGTHVVGGDDRFGLVSVPAALWSTGLNMFGTVYTDLYIGTNGYVTFGKGFSGFSPSGIAGFTRSPMIAAQYDDLYTDAGARNIANGAGSGTSLNTHNMYYFVEGNKLVFTWDNVGLYSSASSSTAGNLGSAFQIILHKPSGDAAADQNFGMEIRYEEVTQQYAGATAGWTAGDKVNYGLINDGVTLSTVAVSSSNVGINGVWAWEVNGGVVSAPYFVPDIGIGAAGVDVASLSFRNAIPTGFTITGDGNGYGFEMSAVTPNGVNSSAVLNTIANPRWNLWKEQYQDGVATITVTPTGAANGAPVTLDINIFDNGQDTVTRVGGAGGTTLQVNATSSDLNNASDTDISTITTVQATTAVSINLGNQTEGFTIAGSTGADTLVGGQGDDAINGGLGNDSLTGGLGNDTFTVGVSGGTDTITDLGVGGDEISASSGIVFATLGASWTPTAATTNSLGQNLHVDANGHLVNLNGTTSTQGWTLTNSGAGALMIGSSMNDNITGGAQDDELNGGNHDDALNGGGGNDTIYGGNGNDTLFGSAGTDELYGEADNDRFDFDFGLGATPANATVDGGLGTDTLHVWSGGNADVVLADSAFLHVSSMENLSLVQSGGHGAVVTLGLNASAAFNTGVVVTAGVGTTLSVDGAAFTETISVTGFTGNDTLIGGIANDTIVGDGGDDEITGNGGTDSLTGGAGNDTFRYDSWGDLFGETVDGGSHTTGDTILFTTGISGENFHSAFTNVTNVENVRLTGANDINLGTEMIGTGITTIFTGTGTTSIRNDDPVLSGITIDATAMLDNVTLSLSDFGGATDFTVTNLRGDLNASVLSTGTLSATAATGAGFAVSMIGGNTVDTFNGGDGADTIEGNNGNDTLNGGAGADRITGGSGADSLFGGTGNDVFVFDVGAGTLISADSVVNGGADTDRIDAWTGIGGGSITLNDTEFANVTNMEVLTMSAGGIATVNLGANADAAFASGITVSSTIPTGRLVVNGASATIAINATGGNANDTITGGSGNDTITGGSGADTINLSVAGTDIDRVVYTTAGGFATDGPAAGTNTGYDIINNFDGGSSDHIIVTGFTGNLSGSQDANLSDNQATNNTSSILVVRDSAVGTGGVLTDDIATALNSAFDLSGLNDGYYVFSVLAGDLDANPATNQYWIGIYNDVSGDDLPLASEIQVLALVTLVAGGIPDSDNFFAL